MASTEDQIKDIEAELAKTKYNKATQHHIGLQKAKMARLKEKQEARGGGGKKGEGYSVKKHGDATIVLVGFPSVGKSTIHNKITNAHSKIGAYQFTTITVVPGVMNYNHAQIQILDIPGLIKGAAAGVGLGKEILSVVRSANLIVFITDPFSLHQIDVLKKELYNAYIRLDEIKPYVKLKKKDRGGVDFATTVKLKKIDKKTVEGMLQEFGYNNCSIVIREDITPDQLIDVVQGNRRYIPSLVIINKADAASKAELAVVKKKYPDAIIISAEKDDMQDVKKKLYDKLDLMRIFMKEVGKKADMDVPMIVKRGLTIRGMCERLHQDFVTRFKYAKVWGPSARFPGQELHGNHVLKDGDIIQINLD